MQEQVFKVVAAILHIGDVHFADAEGDGVSLGGDDNARALGAVASLLQIEESSLVQSLTTHQAGAGGAAFTKNLRPQEAEDSRDAFMKQARSHHTPAAPRPLLSPRPPSPPAALPRPLQLARQQVPRVDRRLGRERHAPPLGRSWWPGDPQAQPRGRLAGRLAVEARCGGDAVHRHPRHLRLRVVRRRQRLRAALHQLRQREAAAGERERRRPPPAPPSHASRAPPHLSSTLSNASTSRSRTSTRRRRCPSPRR